MISEDGAVLRVQQDRVWVGSLDGSGEWIPQESSGGTTTNLGRDGVLVSDHGRLSRYDWQGQLAASYDLGVAPYMDPNSENASVSWSGTVLGVAYRLGADDFLEWYTDRVYFQRFDIDLVPIDPEPILVVELYPNTGDREALDSRSALDVGWDGTEFGVVIAWTQGYGDWGEPALTDVFRFGEEGDVRGSFPLDRGVGGGYVGSIFWMVFDVPESDRLVIAHSAEYWVPVEGGQGLDAWEQEWGGLDLAPLDLQTGQRVAEDGRLVHGGAMARLGGRLALLWKDRERLNPEGTDWIDHVMFAVLDCSETFGID
jgi:hypothetical protein